MIGPEEITVPVLAGSVVGFAVIAGVARLAWDVRVFGHAARAAIIRSRSDVAQRLYQDIGRGRWNCMIRYFTSKDLLRALRIAACTE
jgi:hypothetical protein